MEKTHVMNPFAEDIVYDPRKTPWSLPHLNDAALQRIEEALSQLGDFSAPSSRAGVKSSHTLLITSPQAGYGKSHLIGRLFDTFAGRATQVYIRPFEDPATCWKSLLIRLVQELQFPEHGSGRQPAADGPTQLDAFAISTIARIVVDVIEHLPNPPEGAVKALPELRKPAAELVHIGKSPYWRAFFKALVSDPQWLDAIHLRLIAREVMLHAAHTSWLNVLSSYALDPRDWEARQSVFEWLRGESIDQDMAQRIGIRPADLPEPGQTASLANQLCKERMLDLCQLAGFYRPFLLCFDQTDNYGKDPALAMALGNVVDDLTDQARNQLTVIAANADPWKQRIRVHWQDTQRNRIAQPALQLEALTKTQGKRLASHRLQDWRVTAPQALAFLGDEPWFDRLFHNESRMKPRLFLQHCREHWRHLHLTQAPESAPPVPLERYFERYQDKILSESRRLVFDRDALHWVFAELAKGIPDVEVDRAEIRRGEWLPQWRHNDQRLIFGFESGCHWQTWQTIARRAQQPIKSWADVTWVYPRTPELPPVPGPWPCAAEIRTAMTCGALRIPMLERDWMVKLWAAHDLYSDALQNDIPYAIEEVTQYLHSALQNFWTKLLATPAPAELLPNTYPPAMSAGTKARIQTIVEDARILSVDDLLIRLSLPLARDAILNVCNEIPEIRIHFSPEMTALQWRSAPTT